MLEPFMVEKYVDRPRLGTENWVEVMSVPKATIADARRWLKAQGCLWTTTSLWRIVDRERKQVRIFYPKSF